MRFSRKRGGSFLPPQGSPSEFNLADVLAVFFVELGDLSLGEGGAVLKPSLGHEAKLAEDVVADLTVTEVEAIPAGGVNSG